MATNGVRATSKLPEFLAHAIDASTFPAGPVEARAAKRMVQVRAGRAAGRVSRAAGSPRRLGRLRSFHPRAPRAARQGMRNLDATPRLNLASFVTTYMEPECCEARAAGGSHRACCAAARACPFSPAASAAARSSP